MNREFIIPPNVLTFITTFKCTATCKDCCFQCSPKRTERLSLEDMKSYIDQALIAYPSIKIVVLTGGECFMLGKDLQEIVKYASSNSLLIRIVTNGYWAKTYENAYKRLSLLAQAGLNELNFSTGDDHLSFIPVENIINGAKASMDLGLVTAINVESASNKNFKSNLFFNNEDLQKYIYPEDKNVMPLQIINGVWMPFTKSTNDQMKNQKNSVEISSDAERCTNLFDVITISPDHQMTACCGLTSHCSKYLNLGNVKKYPIQELYENQFYDFMKIWLFTDGPNYIMNYILKKHKIENPFEKSNTHMCQVCEKLLNTPEYLDLIKKDYDNLYTKVMFKYLFNKKAHSTILNVNKTC